jgi:aminopeptidase YwaD
MKTKLSTALLLATLLTIGVVAQQATVSVEADAARLQQHVSYLSSDALQGRRTGTSGANDAAHYIAGEFARLGLRPATQRAGGPRRLSAAVSQYLQPFQYVAGVQLGRTNTLSINSASATSTIQIGTGWMPLGFAANQKIDRAEYVFVGYGITATELNHDDYSTGVKNKIVVALSGTPDGENPHGQFARYEDPRWKAIAARNAGAAALLIVAKDDHFKDDRLSSLRYDSSAADAGFPVAGISRQAALRLFPSITSADELLTLINRASADVSLTSSLVRLSAAVGLSDPASTVSLTTDVMRQEVPAYNVIGILEGADIALKEETIVVGAHYDHLGLGGEGSLAPREGDIHHGADDNASGVAGVLELARMFTAERPRPKRTIVFVAFSGEEEGLLGSNYYVNHPVMPLTKTIAMFNMDMIGRMRDRKLIIGGVGTSQEWRDLISGANASQGVTVSATANVAVGTGVPIVVSANGRPVMTMDSNKTFDLTLQEDGYGPSDHSSFYAKQIPVLFFWTGNHPDYHKPSDTFDKINYTDEARIVSLVARLLRDVDRADKRPTFTTAKSDSTQRTGGFRVYLGTIPNYADSGDGLLLDGVRDDSPAAKAGMKAGDRVVRIGARDVKNVYDYTYALGELKAGQEYTIEVVRGSERLTLKITPEARK